MYSSLQKPRMKTFLVEAAYNIGMVCTKHGKGVSPEFGVLLIL